jgi:rod shape-determining protein MreC
MALLDIRQRTGYWFVAITVAHIILISMQVNTRRGVPVLEAVTLGTFGELQRAASSFIGGLQDNWQNYFALQSVRTENDALRGEIGQLRIKLQQEQALAAQSRTLQQLLDLRSQVTLSTTAAAVIAGGASPDFRTMTIDKGTRAGLRSDMAILAPAGVVGRVITPSAFASKVQLLIDRNAAAGVLDERSRVQGVAVGDGTNRLRLEYLAGTADVKVGDQVVTSGIDGIYPKGFVVGQIESIQRGAGEYTAVVVRPSVDFSAIEAVLVVLTPPAPDTEPSAASSPAADSAPAAPATAGQARE